MYFNRILGKVVNLEQSAANLIFKEFLGDSSTEPASNLIYKEAQRPYVRINTKLSVHRPKHQFISKKEFGYYLAGVIDGDGSISKDYNKISITFHKDDISFALRLRSYIGYGKVSKSSRNSVTYIITHTIGLIYISNLIYGKLMFKSKINNLNLLIERLSEKSNLDSNNTHLGICKKIFTDPVTPSTYDSITNMEISNTMKIFKTSYLAGLIDTDGSLRVRVLNRKNSNIFKNKNM